MKDFRIKDRDHFKSIIKEDNGGTAALSRHVWTGLPPDRKGLIAAYHPLFDHQESFWNHITETAKVIAMDTEQPVFIVKTESHWRLILFGEEREATEDNEFTTWYDNHEDGHYANDQFIAHFDPAGKWHLDGAS